MGLFKNPFSKESKATLENNGLGELANIESKATPENNGLGKWANMGSVAFAGAQTRTPEEVQAEKIHYHQNKIINTIMTGNVERISDDRPEIADEEREGFIRAVEVGNVHHGHWDLVLNSVEGPIDKKEPEEILDMVHHNLHESRILSYMAGPGFDRYEDMNVGTVIKFKQLYPNPRIFEETSNAFMARMKEVQTPAKYAEYERDMEKFKKDMYGKKQEYWDAMKLLQSEAAEKAKIHDTFDVEKYMDKAKVNGDQYIAGGVAYSLSPELLKQAGLEPKTEVEIEGKKIGLSDVFMADNSNRPACISYVQTDKGVKVNSYYRSNSSGEWRLLPEYAVDGERVCWYGKGYSEESLSLPFELQKKLTEIAEKPPVDMSGKVPEFYLVGTAKRFTNVEDFLAAKEGKSLKGTHYEGSSATPLYNFGILVQGSKKSPETVSVDMVEGPISPNFGQELDSYAMDTDLYGHVVSRQYASENGHLKYTFCETAKNGERQAWIGNIEVSGGVTDAGTPKFWVSMGDVGTPLYEYWVASGSYGNINDRKGRYVNMWDNYLSRMPIIQKYLSETEPPVL